MWTYTQKDGSLLHDGVLIGTGYSGHGPGVDNPALESVPNEGPIPAGLYEIGAPTNTQDHGPFVLPLTPDAGDQLYERFGFLIHGDKIGHVGEKIASEGCIVLSYPLRAKIWTSGDHQLRVIA
jgi:hypothetical protein